MLASSGEDPCVKEDNDEQPEIEHAAEADNEATIPE